MSRLHLVLGVGCVVHCVAVLPAQEPSVALRDAADQEIQRLRGEVSELTTELQRLETRLEANENLLRELVRERRGMAIMGEADTPLEEIRLAEPLWRSHPTDESGALDIDLSRDRWRKEAPEEMDAWIRPPFRPGPRYHWDTFPSPPHRSGP